MLIRRSTAIGEDHAPQSVSHPCLHPDALDVTERDRGSKTAERHKKDKGEALVRMLRLNNSRDRVPREAASADQFGLESSSPPLATTATTATRATTPSSGSRNGAPARSFLRLADVPMRIGEPAASTIFTLSKLTACGRAGAAYAVPMKDWLASAAPRMIFLNMISDP